MIVRVSRHIDFVQVWILSKHVDLVIIVQLISLNLLSLEHHLLQVKTVDPVL